MIEAGQFIVTREIAERSGLLAQRYRTTDGRFILGAADLHRVTLKPSEYVTGLQGVERISDSQAKTLIAEGGFLTGDEVKKKTSKKKKS